MKITMIVGAFPPKYLAGTEIATYNISMHLAARGHEVHVITSSTEGLPYEDMADGFYIHRIPFGEKRLLGVLSFWAHTPLYIKSIKPDVVHSQSIVLGLSAFIAKKILKKPYIIWCRGSEVYLDWPLKKAISSLVLKNASAIIALTEDLKASLEKSGYKDIAIIPNGIDLKKCTTFSKSEVRRRLSIGSTDKVIVFIGRLNPVKGTEYLVKAMSIIIQKERTARLIIVGSDQGDRSKLEKLAEDLKLGNHVLFTGQVSNEKVHEYLKAADIFVLPSLSEGFPNTILEAMASGLPLVVTDVGGIKEIIKHEKNGLLINSRDSEQIADSVLLLFRDKDMRDRMSSNNKERAKEYNWETVIAKLEIVYNKSLNLGS